MNRFSRARSSACTSRAPAATLRVSPHSIQRDKEFRLEPNSGATFDFPRDRTPAEVCCFWRLLTIPKLRYRITILNGRLYLGEIGIRGWGPCLAHAGLRFCSPRYGVWLCSLCTIGANAVSMIGLPVRGADQVLAGVRILDCWKIFAIVSVA